MDNTGARVTRATKPEELRAEGASAPAATSSPEAKLLNPNGRSITVPLEYPLEYDGVTYHSLTAHRLLGKDLSGMRMMAHRLGLANQDTLLLSTMCRVPFEVIDNLDADDLASLAEKATPFMPRYVQALLAPPDGSSGPSTPQT